MEQRSRKSACFSTLPSGRTPSATAAGVVIVSPQPNGAGEMTEGED